MTPARYVQQSVAPELGEELALQLCVPTCFYMVARAAGYLQGNQAETLADFCRQLNWQDDFTEAGGWIRPRLSADLRRRYGWPIVSWHFGGAEHPTDADIERMKAAGYLATTAEVAFFKEQVVGHDLADIVQAGYPVIAGMKPEFGVVRDKHAVVIGTWDDTGVEIIDPDDRNLEHHYLASYIREYLNPTGGGCTVILPTSA